MRCDRAFWPLSLRQLSLAVGTALIVLAVVPARAQQDGGAKVRMAKTQFRAFAEAQTQTMLEGFERALELYIEVARVRGIPNAPTEIGTEEVLLLISEFSSDPRLTNNRFLTLFRRSYFVDQRQLFGQMGGYIFNEFESMQTLDEAELKKLNESVIRPLVRQTVKRSDAIFKRFQRRFRRGKGGMRLCTDAITPLIESN